MSFQDNLRMYRERLGVNAKDFANQLEIKYTTYAGYENQGKEPKYDTLCKIAAALHVSIDDLLGYTAPSEHQRLVKLAESWGLVVNEKDGQIIVSLPESGTSQLNKREKERWEELSRKLSKEPLPAEWFDVAIQGTEKSITQRNLQQVIMLALDNLECGLFFTR